MIKKVILFGDMFINNRQIFLKSAAVLRLSYILRKKNFDVKQVHHCTSFNYEELKKIITDFAKGEKTCLCVSTSFLSSGREASYYNNKNDKKPGIAWGIKNFLFLLTIGRIAKELDLPYVLGGWDISKKKILDNNITWGFDLLEKCVTYFVESRNINVVEDICNDTIEYELIGNKKVVTKIYNTEFSDNASTPLNSDLISEKETLITELADGCIFSCSFCNYASLGKKKNEYTRSYESLEKEIIENYKNFKTNFYQLTDNIVNDTREKLKFLIKIRNKTGIDLKWVGYVRLDTIQTKEHAIMLRDSGMKGAAFGIESFYKQTGPYIGKITDKKRLLNSLSIMRDVFGDTAIFTGLFIAGLPQEPLEHIIDTHKWLNSIDGRYYIDHYSYTPFYLSLATNDKNPINIARNNPYRNYDYNPSNNSWVSPWTSYEEVIKITNEMFLEKTNLVSPFNLTYLNNMGYDIDDLILNIRDHARKGLKFNLNFSKNVEKNIENYKLKILERNNEQIHRE